MCSYFQSFHYKNTSFQYTKKFILQITKYYKRNCLYTFNFCYLVKNNYRNINLVHTCKDVLCFWSEKLPLLITEQLENILSQLKFSIKTIFLKPLNVPENHFMSFLMALLSQVHIDKKVFFFFFFFKHGCRRLELSHKFSGWTNNCAVM